MSGMQMSQVVIKNAYTEVPGDADKQTVIRQLAEKLVSCGQIAEDQVDTIVEIAMNRESMGSTGIGHGIAIPHCRCDVVDDIICAYGACADGLDFNSLDGEPVYSIFFIVTPNAKKDEHRDLMKNFAGQIRKENFKDFLRQAVDAEGVINLLAEFEEN